jgi:hypothetical protein
MLLSHTSAFFAGLMTIKKLNINFEPGQVRVLRRRHLLLQLVVETIANKPLKELMQDRVFQPLGMARTGMISEAFRKRLCQRL